MSASQAPANPELVARLRRIAQAGRPAPPAPAPAAGTARCDLCGSAMADDHRHLLHLEDRRILCSCEPCWAMRAGDPGLRPTGTRNLRLEGFDLDDELWAQFQIPIGLAFFMRSEAAGAVIGLYPSPAGATECELYLSAWNDLERRNPVLATLESEVEALVVNRLKRPAEHAIVPIDRCYELVGMIKASWQGISGGSAVEDAVTAFFVTIPASAERRW